MTDMTLDDAVEAVSVATGLGMYVPAIPGTRVWTAGFAHKYEDYAYEALCVDMCSSKDIAIESLRNLMLPQLINSFKTDQRTTRDYLLNGKTIEEYIANASTAQIIKDYEFVFDCMLYVKVDDVIGVAPEPFTADEVLHLAKMFEDQLF